MTLLIQFLVRDEPNVARFQSGLFNVRGSAKPASFAFRLPLAQVTRNGRARHALGTGAAGHGRAAVPAPGANARILALARLDAADELARLHLAAPSTVPAGSLVRIWSPQDGGYGWPLLVR